MSSFCVKWKLESIRRVQLIISDVHTITTPVVTQLVGDNMSIPADIVSIIVSGKMHNLIQFRYRVMVYFHSKHTHKT